MRPFFLHKGRKQAAGVTSTVVHADKYQIDLLLKIYYNIVCGYQPSKEQISML
jgi:hypothetical protein